MRKLLIATLAVALPACCMMIAPKRAPEKPTMAEQLERDTVAIVQFVDDRGYAVDPDEMVPTHPATLRAFCAGVWVSHDAFVTAFHCVNDAGKPAAWKELSDAGAPMKTWDPTGQQVMYSNFGDIVARPGLPDTQVWHRATIVAADPDDDLSLLRDPKPAAHSLARLSRNAIHDGDDVHIVGHTLGMAWTYSRGNVASTRLRARGPHNLTVKVLQVSGPAWQGNSGGGAYDAEGNLIGICLWIHTDGPDMAFFAHRDVVKALLDHNRIE